MSPSLWQINGEQRDPLSFSVTASLNHKWQIEHEVAKTEASNLFFHYTRCITPKRVMSVRCPSPNEFTGPISASLRPGNTAPFEEILQRWRAVGHFVSDLTGLRFEPQTSCSRDERVTARPRGRLQASKYIRSSTKMTNRGSKIVTRTEIFQCVVATKYAVIFHLQFVINVCLTARNELKVQGDECFNSWYQGTL